MEKADIFMLPLIATSGEHVPVGSMPRKAGKPEK